MYKLCEVLSSESYWVTKKHSKIRFWQDNWLRVPLITMLPHVAASNKLLIFFWSLNSFWDIFVCFQFSYTQVASLIEWTYVFFYHIGLEVF